MIYCIEDDRDIRELMLYTLRTAGYEAEDIPREVRWMRRWLTDYRH